MDGFDAKDLFISIGRAWTEWLVNLGLEPGWVSFINSLIGAILITAIPVVIVVFTIMGERKIIGRFQDRLGPNRVGPFGFFQTIPDVIKLLTKEIVTPDNVDKAMYNVAPLLAVVAVILIWGVMPFADKVMGVDLNIGAVYFVAVSSSMSMNEIVKAQAQGWYVVLAPIGMLVFFISSTAEIGRSPFDLLEADSEIVAGYNIEYSGMRFAMFFLGEWIHAFTICGLTATLFFGGWQGPWVDQVPALGVVYFLAKMFALYFIHIWIRTTMPRLRIDHLLSFNWKFLVPLSLVNLVVMALLAKLVEAPAADATFWAELPRMGIFFVANLRMALGTFLVLGAVARRERRKHEESAELEPATTGL
jgi:NADH-quinone oxidoreductase subunit H